MQLAWYICHTTLGLYTCLFRLRPASNSITGIPALNEIQMERSGTPLELPPLSQRVKYKLEEMLDFFLKSKKKEFNYRKMLKLSLEARKMILAYPFPGNIRELENLVGQLYVYSGEFVDVKVLPGYFQAVRRVRFQMA